MAVQGQRGIVGLTNLGNTCYLSSVVQALSSVSEVKEYFVNGVFEEHLNFSSQFGGQVASALAEVLTAMWDGLHDSYSPTRFKAVAGFPGSQQHDAADFFTALVNKLHEDLDTVLVRQPAPLLDTANLSHGAAADLALQNQEKAEGKSFLTDRFYGQSRTDIKCNQCGVESSVYDRFLELQVPIAPAGGLQRLLEKEVEPEVIERQCPQCDHQQATKTLHIIRLPKILCVQLKRFFFNTQRNFSGKIDRFVDFPMDLDLTQLITGDRSEFKTYKLQSVVNHYGQSSYSGHYTTMAFSSNLDKWIHCNDSHLTSVSPRRIKSSSAYLLFFVASEEGQTAPLSSSARGRSQENFAPTQPRSTSRSRTPPPRPGTPNLSNLMSGVTVQDQPMEQPSSRQESAPSTNQANQDTPQRGGNTAAEGEEDTPPFQAEIGPVRQGRHRRQATPRRTTGRVHRRLERDEDGNPIVHQPSSHDHTYGEEPPRVHRRVLTPKQRAFVIKTFYSNGGKYSAVAALWCTHYPNSGPAPTRKLVKNTVKDFEERGFDYKKGKGPKATKVTDELIRQVTQVANTQTKWNRNKKRSSTRRNVLGVKPWNYCRAMKAAGMCPFKKKKKQKLLPGSHLKRLRMAKWMMRRNSRFYTNLCSVDESPVDLDGTSNRQNQRDYQPWGSGGSMDWIHERQVHPPGVQILTGMVGCGVKLPIVFLDGTLTGTKYLRILQEVFIPYIRDHPLTREAFRRGLLTWQHDGAGAHCTGRVLRYLGHVFNGQVISHKARIYITSRKAKEWAPYSCDMTPCDFFLFNQMKSGESPHAIFSHPIPQSIPELKEKIQTVMDALNPDNIRRAFQNMRARAFALYEAKGGHFSEDKIPRLQ